MEDVSIDKITIRKRQRSCSLSNSNTTLLNSMFETTTRSLPDTSIENQSTNEKECKINQLKEELETANQEIETLNYENTCLKKELEKYKKLIDVYKKVGGGLSDSLLLRTPDSLTKRTHSKKLNTFGMSTPKTLLKNTTELQTQQNITSPDQPNTPSCGKETDAHKKLSNHDNTESPRNMLIAKEASVKRRKNIIIMADHQGKMVQSILQSLVGDDYYVTCMWKQGARLRDVLNSFKSDMLTLSNDDYIVIAGGTNDVNPREFQFHTAKWLESATNTNVIFTEIPYNRFLNIKKLNYELKFMCSKFKNVQYLDLDYEKHLPKGLHFSLNLCRSWLREILRIDYKLKLITYNETKMAPTQKNMVNSSTQTDFIDFNTNHDTLNSSKQEQNENQIIETKNTVYECCTPSMSPKDNNFFRV